MVNTNKSEHFAIAAAVAITGTTVIFIMVFVLFWLSEFHSFLGLFGFYYFAAALSYQLLSNETALLTIAEPTVVQSAPPAPSTSRPHVPHLPSIIERSFSMIPSNDATTIRKQKPTHSDHRFVGPMY